MHRIDSGHIERPYRAPTILIVLGTIFAFVNAVFMGAGAKVWNPNALWAGLIRRLIIPVFALPALRPGQGQVPRSHARRIST